MTDDLFSPLDDDPSKVVMRPRWQEVPQARFLSWPEKMQLAYCAARDEDAALDTETDDEMEWFLKRALMYREMMR